MKKIVLLAIAFISFAGFSQNQYEKGMQKAFELWHAEKPWEAANIFERIAQAEPDNWLPSYYVAKINVINSFDEKDETKLKSQLDKARNYINDAMAISKDNPEILVLDAQWYTAWIAFDGQQYGMKYAGKVAQIYRTAFELAPENPRVILGKAEWDMGAAQFFGKPVTPYCNDIKRAIELFATFKPESEFHPSYGLERAKEILEKNCKE